MAAQGKKALDCFIGPAALCRYPSRDDNRPIIREPSDCRATIFPCRQSGIGTIIPANKKTRLANNS